MDTAPEVPDGAWLPANAGIAVHTMAVASKALARREALGVQSDLCMLGMSNRKESRLIGLWQGH